MRNNADLKFRIAQILFQERQDVEKAMQFNEAALKLDPDNTDAKLLQGKMLIKEKRGKEAIEILESALQK